MLLRGGVAVAFSRDEDAVLDDAADTKDADVAEDDSDEHDDWEPKLLRRSSLLLSTRSCSVFLLSLAVLLALLSDETPAVLLVVLLKLLLLPVLLCPLFPSTEELFIRALTDSEYARRASMAEGRFTASSADRGAKSLDIPTLCTFFSRALGVVRAAMPSLLPPSFVVGDDVAAGTLLLRPGVGILEILDGVRSLEGLSGTLVVSMTRDDVSSSSCWSSLVWS